MGVITQSRNRQWPERGFTLVELLIVLFLFGLLLTFVVPSFSRPGTLSSSSRQLTADIRTVRAAAAATKRLHRLHLDLDQRTYWVAALDGDRDVPVTGLLPALTTLPDGIRFRDVLTPTQGALSTGRAFIQFFPLGRTERVVIHLQEGEDRFLTLAVSPITGHIEIRDGYQEPPAQDPVSSRFLPYMTAVTNAGSAPPPIPAGLR